MTGWLAELGRLAEPALVILVALGDGPKHGYAIMSESEAISGTPMGPGTLYAALARLESRGLVEALPAEDRRRPVPAHGRRGAGGTRASRSARRPRARRARTTRRPRRGIVAEPLIRRRCRPSR